MTCRIRRHDTIGAYRAGCRCPRAVAAKARYDKQWRLGTNAPRFVDVIGSRRRIQALAAIGWRIGDLANRLGISDRDIKFLRTGTHVTRTTAADVARLYDELCWTFGGSEITRSRAARNGWPPPLAWDDDEIDDPKARPKGAVASHDIDELAVQLAVKGQLGTRKLTRREAHAAIRRMRELGIPTGEIARRANVSERTVHRQGHEHTTTAAA